MILQKFKMVMFHLKCGHKIKISALLFVFMISLIATGVGASDESNTEIKTLVQEFDLKIKTEFTLQFDSP